MQPWNTYDAFLFDIDGTLMNCTDAVHYFAFCAALSTVAGRPLNLDGVTTHGNVDVGILRDAFARSGVAESDWRPRLSDLRASMASFVQQRRSDLRAVPLPGVVPVLEHLHRRGVLLGVATGNLEAIGWAKLEAAGLRPFFHFGGFSDLFETRADVFHAAAALARQHAGSEARLCVVGDTPSDIQAAQANGLDVIAVATGIYTVADLQPFSPTLCIASLEDLPHAAYLRS